MNDKEKLEKTNSLLVILAILLVCYAVIYLFYSNKYIWTSIILMTLFTIFLFSTGVIILVFTDMIDGKFIKKDKKTKEDCVKDDDEKNCGLWDENKNICFQGRVEEKKCNDIKVPFIVYIPFVLGILNIIISISLYFYNKNK